MNKLHLDQDKITEARTLAKAITEEVETFILKHTTLSVERSILRLLGVHGANPFDVPYVNLAVDYLHEKGLIHEGVSLLYASFIKHYQLDPQTLTLSLIENQVDLAVPRVTKQEAITLLYPYLHQAFSLIDSNKEKRASMLKTYPDDHKSLRYVICATGNIHEDIIQAKAAAKQGADIIAVIRTTGQSLLDYVPEGITTEGFGGTYATQANFALMRKALDEVSLEEKRYIRLVNYASGLCMPEITVLGAVERLDMLLNDSMYGIIFRDINMQRTLIDQYFSRKMCAYADITINTGEDNYLTTSDAFLEAHTVLASQFINEQFAKMANMKEAFMGLGHAFEMDPHLKSGFLYELSQALMAREIFPSSPLKYMPPTKFMTGNIFLGQLQNVMFNLVTAITEQPIHLLGMMTEAIHTPFISDRHLAIQNAKMVNNSVLGFLDEIHFNPEGIIIRRAHQVVDEALALLKDVKADGLFTTLEKGVFAGVKRYKDKGKGLSGVIEVAPTYFNAADAYMEVK